MEDVDFYRDGVFLIRVNIGQIRRCARGLCWKMITLQWNKWALSLSRLYFWCPERVDTVTVP